MLPSGKTTTVKSIDFFEDQLPEAEAGASITLTLNDEVDVSRGDLIVTTDHPPEVADQFQVKLLWLSEEPLVPGRSYWLKVHAKEVSATVMEIKHREDINTGSHLAAKVLNLNEIAVVTISTTHPVAFEPYTVNRTLGGFVFIDKLSCATVGAGMIEFALRRSTNIHWQSLEVGKAQRALLKNQTPRCIWFTGLSGSGKSTCLNLIGGLDNPTSGQIFIKNKEIGSLSRKELTIFRRRNIGFVFQNYSLMPVLNVYDNVALPVTFDCGKHINRKYIEELLRELGIWEKRKKYPNELSGGQQQRVAIIRSIALRPRLLLLDEITSALDPVLVNEVLSTVRDLKNDGMTMVLATHEMGFAKQVADEVCYLEAGQIVERGSAQQMIETPQDQRTIDFLKRVHEAGRL